jgi:SAM-dependent methyltransferase
MSKKVVKPIAPFKPLVCPKAVAYFESILCPEFTVYETGSGGSTLWLAERVARVVTVEQNLDWAEVVQGTLEENGLDNVELCLIGEQTHGRNFYDDYAEHIREYPRASFDLVFVDGSDRTRVRTMMHARRRLKPGGWLVLDDSNWPKLTRGMDKVRDWPHVTLCGWKTGAADGKARFGCTTFWRKPMHALPRVGVVSDWTKQRQRHIAGTLYNALDGYAVIFLLIRGDPSSDYRQEIGVSLTYADFKTNEGIKEFCRPAEWADEHDLDAVVYTEPRQEQWLEFMREQGTPDVRVFAPEGNVYEAVEELVEDLRDCHKGARNETD